MAKLSLLGGVAAAAVTVWTLGAQAAELRLLTWSGYAPDEVIAEFKKATGHDVKVTTSNNEDIISKLRATQGAGFDLAQPSQDRITGANADFQIYKPFDMSKVKTDLFIPSMLEATKKNTTADGKVYGLPHIWGTDGIVLNTATAKNVSDYVDICSPDNAGKISYRLRRPILIAFAFSMGMDPFAAYNDRNAYAAIMDKVGNKLIDCKKNVKTYWEGADGLINLMRTGEVSAAIAWDFAGWKLNNEIPTINFLPPKSGALGWIDTFALPARGRADDAAYQWINFVMQPQVAAKIVASAGNFTASKGSDQLVETKLRQQFAASYPQAAIDNIKWYPAVPAGLEEIEGKVLDRVKAAN